MTHAGSGASAAGSDTVVRIAGVDKTFARDGVVVTTALSGIDLSIRRGEFVSLIGPSGCGKSTLLKAIGGYLQPVEGEIVLNGARIDRPGRDRAFVFQNVRSPDGLVMANASGVLTAHSLTSGTTGQPFVGSSLNGTLERSPGSFGSPRMRSPTMFRWIWSVPP